MCKLLIADFNVLTVYHWYCNNCGTIKTTSKHYSTKNMCTLQSFSKEVKMYGLLSNEEPMIRILVSRLNSILDKCTCTHTHTLRIYHKHLML